MPSDENIMKKNDNWSFEKVDALEVEYEAYVKYLINQSATGRYTV